jgi:hypothetical protein
MLLPVMGFFLGLLAVGGLGSLVTMADPTRARFFPLTMAMLFSGLGVWGLVIGFGFLGELIGGQLADTLGFLGILVGALGGSALGFVIGSRRNRRLNISKPEAGS